MKCFTHQDKEAVGVCSVCCKGICSECAADLDYSLACKSSCEKEVHSQESEIHSLESIVRQSEASLKASRRNRYLTPALFAGIGLSLTYLGIERYPRGNSSLVMGIVFLVIAGIYYIVIRKGARELDKNLEQSSPISSSKDTLDLNLC